MHNEPRDAVLRRLLGDPGRTDMGDIPSAPQRCTTGCSIGVRGMRSSPLGLRGLCVSGLEMQDLSSSSWTATADFEAPREAQCLIGCTAVLKAGPSSAREP